MLHISALLLLASPVLYTDIKYKKIYNVHILILFIVSLFLLTPTFSVFFTQFIIGCCIALILYILGFYSAGDAKLLIVFTAFLPLSHLLSYYILVAIWGGGIALIYLYIVKEKIIPYGVAIFFGTVSYYLMFMYGYII